jgi:hypothetical protein
MNKMKRPSMKELQEIAARDFTFFTTEQPDDMAYCIGDRVTWINENLPLKEDIANVTKEYGGKYHNMTVIGYEKFNNRTDVVTAFKNAQGLTRENWVCIPSLHVNWLVFLGKSEEVQ